MIYTTIDEAVLAARNMCEVLETYVKITKCENGYELFGTGEFVMEIKE